MTKVEYVEIMSEKPLHETKVHEIAKELEKVIYQIQKYNGLSLRFLCSNFIWTKSVYGKADNNTICNEPNNTLYEFMIFFDEKYE